jgi:hypothetical protein
MKRKKSISVAFSKFQLNFGSVLAGTIVSMIQIPSIALASENEWVIDENGDEIKLRRDGGETATSFTCTKTNKSLKIEIGLKFYDTKPSAPTSIILMPSEVVVELEGSVTSHADNKYSFQFLMRKGSEILDQLGKAEMLVFWGINDFEGEGILLDQASSTKFVSKCFN